MKTSIMAGALALAFSAAAIADDRVVRFDGGIGVIPVNSTGANTVRGITPGGQPWVISRLTADVRSDGSISVDGRGLLLAGGNGIGTNGGLSVRALLFCGPGSTTPIASQVVPLEPNGDFRIDGALSATPPDPCVSPVLLIAGQVTVAGTVVDRWFAAGIPKI
jgi:hypothetical protein